MTYYSPNILGNRIIGIKTTRPLVVKFTGSQGPARVSINKFLFEIGRILRQTGRIRAYRVVSRGTFQARDSTDALPTTSASHQDPGPWNHRGDSVGYYYQTLPAVCRDYVRDRARLPLEVSTPIKPVTLAGWAIVEIQVGSLYHVHLLRAEVLREDACWKPSEGTGCHEKEGCHCSCSCQASGLADAARLS